MPPGPCLAAASGRPILEEVEGGYDRLQFFPFDPVVKRTVAVLRDRSTGRRVRVSKGLVSKLLDTGDDGGQGGTWVCKDVARVRPVVEAADARLGKKGYKTVAVVRERAVILHDMELTD